MKKLGIALFALLTLQALPAGAGERSTWNVYIDTNSRYAAGSMGDARNSADNTQVIYCGASTMHLGTGVGWSAGCYAYDAKGRAMSCWSSGSDAQTQEIARAIMSLSGDSFVGFRADANGNCKQIDVVHASHNAPKNP